MLLKGMKDISPFLLGVALTALVVCVIMVIRKNKDYLQRFNSVIVEGLPESFKPKLDTISNKQFDELKKRVDKLTEEWLEDDKLTYKKIIEKCPECKLPAWVGVPDDATVYDFRKLYDAIREEFFTTDEFDNLERDYRAPSEDPWYMELGTDEFNWGKGVTKTDAYQLANTFKGLVEKEFPDAKITIVDGRTNWMPETDQQQEMHDFVWDLWHEGYADLTE